MMKKASEGLNRLGLLLGALIVVALPSTVHSANKAEQLELERGGQVQRLELVVGKSKVLDAPVPIKRASLANPDVADTVILSPTQIYLTGKSVGVTNLTLWQDAERILSVVDVVVMPDVSRVKEDLHRLFPEEKGITVTASQDKLSLAGTVSNAAVLPKVLEMAEAYAPKKVVNLLQVGGVQQVMLEIRVAEMNRELIRRLGINFVFNGPDNFGISLLSQLAQISRLNQTGASLSALELIYSQTVNGVFGLKTGSLSWQGIIDALKEQNLVKILAKPTLVAMSGQEAAFLAGRRIPDPSSTGLRCRHRHVQEIRRRAHLYAQRAQ